MIFEIPKPSMEVIEHQVLVKQCPHCQSKIKGKFPQGVNTPVSDEERIKVVKFIKKPEIPFTNNQAERDLRMMKCKQKVSGSFRTMKRAKNFATIRSVISTVKKQGLDILESIKGIMQGKTIVFLELHTSVVTF